MASVETDLVPKAMLWLTTEKNAVTLRITREDDAHSAVTIRVTAAELWRWWCDCVELVPSLPVVGLPPLEEPFPELEEPFPQLEDAPDFPNVVGGDDVPLPPPAGEGPDWCPFA